MTNLKTSFLAFLLLSSLLAPISALGAVELQLGQPTGLSSSRVDESGNSFSIGRIYRSAPELRSARADDTLTFYAPDGTAHSATITKAIDTDRGNRLLNAIADGTTIVAVVNANGDFFSSIRANGDYFQSAIYEGQTVVYDSAAGEIVSNPFLNDQLMPEKLSRSSSEELQVNEVTAQAEIISVGILADAASQNAYDVIALADYFIEVANQSYQDVGVDIVFETVAIASYTPYLSQSDMSLSLYDISCGSTSCNPFSSDNSSVISWRDANKADLVVQIVRYGTNGGTCGIAWTPGPNGADDFTTYLKDLTYSVNALELPNGTYCPDIVVAHEMGHNFGLGHDRTTGCGTTYFSYACGYKNVSQGFGSVMSYVPSSQYVFGLSNPNLTVNGYPFGVPIGQSGEAFAAQAVANVSYLHSDIYENTTTTTFTVTPSANSGGSISPSSAQSVESGSTVSFTLTPNSNYTIGTISGTCPQGSFNGSTYTTGPITANCSVVANFDPPVTVNPPELSSVSTQQTSASQASATLTFSPPTAGQAPSSYEAICTPQSAIRQISQELDIKGDIPSPGLILKDGQMSLAGQQALRAFHQSEEFRTSGARCGTLIPPTQSRTTSDCTLGSTTILDDYDPLVNATYVIPVIFHIIYKNDGTGFVSEQRIYDQMAALNEDYAGALGLGIDTTIRFELSGIYYYQNDAAYADSSTEALNLKRNNTINAAQNINIFTNDASGYLGYAYFPQWGVGATDDYITMLAASIGGRDNGFGNYDQGRTLVHEIGHQLGLLHTFGEDGVCDGNTFSTGDLIVDTPEQKNADYGSVSSNECPSGVPSAINNFMNYSIDDALFKFSQQQTNRMICNLQNYRTDSYEVVSVNNTPVTASGTSSPITVSGLDAGKTYSCTVKSIYGSSESSDATAITILAGDADGDGVLDYDDAFPNDPTETTDTDGEGLGDNLEGTLGTDPENPDTDGDGYTDYEEYVEGTDPLDDGDPGSGGLPIWLLYQATQ